MCDGLMRSDGNDCAARGCWRKFSKNISQKKGDPKRVHLDTHKRERKKPLKTGLPRGPFVGGFDTPVFLQFLEIQCIYS